MTTPTAGHQLDVIRPNNTVLLTALVSAAVLFAGGAVAVARFGAQASLPVTLGVALLVAAPLVVAVVLVGRTRLAVADGVLSGRSPRFKVLLADVRRVDAVVMGFRYRFYALRLFTDDGPNPTAIVQMMRYRPDDIEALFLAELTARRDVSVDPTVGALRSVWRSRR